MRDRLSSTKTQQSSNILNDAFLHNNIDLETFKKTISSTLKLTERVTYTFIRMSHNGNILQKFQEEQIKMKKKT